MMSEHRLIDANALMEEKTMTERSFDEMIAYFNRRVADMDIDQDCKIELLGMVAALGYKHKQTAQRWIPCGERLPEYEEEVLVTRHFLSDNELKKNAITESFYVEVASRMDDEWTSYSDEYKIKRHLHKVIAWMQLPDPWRGEEDEPDK